MDIEELEKQKAIIKIEMYERSKYPEPTYPTLSLPSNKEVYYNY
jgi:hypothetical protein